MLHNTLHQYLPHIKNTCQSEYWGSIPPYQNCISLTLRGETTQRLVQLAQTCNPLHQWSGDKECFQWSFFLKLTEIQRVLGEGRGNTVVQPLSRGGHFERVQTVLPLDVFGRCVIRTTLLHTLILLGLDRHTFLNQWPLCASTPKHGEDRPCSFQLNQKDSLYIMSLQRRKKASQNCFISFTKLSL